MKGSSMTPSTDASFGGFLQGMQANMMSIVGTIIFILMVWLLARFIISKMTDNEDDATSAKRFINWSAAIVVLLSFVGFSMNAMTFATNQIPHSDLDKSPVYNEMNSNIEKQQ
jgi:heme A synthase